MNESPSYPAARVVAERLEARIATSPTAYKSSTDAPKPDARTIEEIITKAFWASLRREEGRPPRISIAFLPPEQSARPLQFIPRVRLEPGLLARLAPAVENPGIHIGVWWYDGELYAWGVTRSVPTWCFVIEVVGPGLLVVKYRRDDPSTKFANIAVLEGADVKFIEQQPSAMSEAPAALSSLLEFYSSAGRNESDNILVKVAIAMRAHGRGGSLLVVPNNTDQWRDSIVQPITYALIPPSPDGAIQAAEALAGLTAVDGATIITDTLEPVAFGAKILTRDGVNRVDQILFTEPIERVPDRMVDPAHLGGTRHLSAAQFAHDQRNSVALVASQDGQFTVFAWSPVKNIVHAHRLDALLI
jgi:DNA integrity scanning protein DisA with diadenylate cyclase activity